MPEDEITELKKRIAIQGAALYKAFSIFETIGRDMTLPDDIHGLAMTGSQLCDKALLEAGWPASEKPGPPEGPQGQKLRPE